MRVVGNAYAGGDVQRAAFHVERLAKGVDETLGDESCVVIIAVGVIGGLWPCLRSSGRAGPASAAEDDELPADPADFS